MMREELAIKSGHRGQRTIEAKVEEFSVVILVVQLEAFLFCCEALENI